MKRTVWTLALLASLTSFGAPALAQNAPTFAWSAKAGVPGGDMVSDIAVDRFGNSFITGRLLTQPGRMDKAFLTKVHANGTIAWTQVFGGEVDSSEGIAVTVDVAGDAYVLGNASPDFPFTGGDIFAGIEPRSFMARFDRDGTMISARAIGLPGLQYYGRDLAVNDQNQIIVVANVADVTNPSARRDWVQVDLLDESAGRTTLARLEGSLTDAAASVAVHSSGRIYVTGSTMSGNFPLTANALDSAIGVNGFDAFVTVLEGSTIVYSTFAGGTGSDVGQHIAVDQAENVYLLAHATSTDFPGSPAGPPTYARNAWVLKLDASRAIVYSARIPGPIVPGQLAVDSTGRVYVTGYADNSQYPVTPDAFSTTFIDGSVNPVIARLDASGTAVDWSTFLTFPGDQVTTAALWPAVAVDAAGGVYIGQSAFNSAFFNGSPDDEPIFTGEDVWDQDYRRNSLVAKFATEAPPVVNTPIGGSITFNDASSSVTFAGVTDAGETTITPVDPAALNLAMPGGFQLSASVQAIDITTTASVLAPIRVCFDATALTDDDFGRAEVLHGVGASWVVEPTTRDLATRTICASVSSLSPFAVGIRSVTHRVEALFDQTKSHKAGSTIPVKIRLVNASGANVSSPDLALTVRQIVKVSTQASSQVTDAGTANADSAFRYSDGAYIFNLSTKGLTVGTYELQFTAGSDPAVLRVAFSVR